MLYRTFLLCAPIIALAACGSYAPNSNASAPVTLAGATKMDSTGVQLVNSAPGTAVELSGMDCKNKLWNPTPTQARAIDVLKAQAKQVGYTKVKLTSVDAVKSPLALNCWSAMEAKGLAY